MKTGIEWNGRQNHLNVLRFLAAALVIFSHAFVLTNNGSDVISKVTGAQTTGGQLAVLLFFFYGGLLIMKSMEGKREARAFFRARVLRIFPALWIVVLCSALLLGPALTTLSLSEYFANMGTWKYLLNGLLIPVHNLPGVFESNPAMTTVNGALWTLPVEFGCYIMCFVLYRLGLTRGKTPLLLLPVVLVGGIGAWLALKRMPVLQNAVLPVMFFYIGMVCWLYRERVPVNGWIALAAAALLALSAALRIFAFTAGILYPPVLLYLAFGTGSGLSGFGRRLELSYAMYLTGFPIQQTLIHFNPAMSPWANFALACCLAVCIGVPITLLDRCFLRRMNGRRMR